MLSSLQIENVAVIQKAEVHFEPGLNVLTGETGAGKSILIDSINAILGNRTSKDLVRTGAAKAVIRAAFEQVPPAVLDKLEQSGYERSEALLLSREITAEGKSSCRINGMPATAAVLRELCGGLININGQHDSVGLLNPAHHLGILDDYAQNRTVFQEYYALYRELVRVKRELDALITDEAEKQRKIDLLQYQVQEIEDAGLNVLTGETGAGKSILIDSINAILGNRTSKDLVRTGAAKAVIRAAFEQVPPAVLDKLEQSGYERSEALLLSREITAEGKSSCRINGMPATAAVLRELCGGLININGQHDSVGLLNPAHHLGILDDYAQNRTVFQEYYALYRELVRVKRELDALITDEAEKQRKIDLLQYQVQEIEDAGLTAGEEQALENRRKVLSNASAIRDRLAQSYALLSGSDDAAGAVDLLGEASNAVDAAAQLDPALTAAAGQLLDLYYNAKDVAADLIGRLDTYDTNDAELDEVEQRLDLLYRLKRKYGSTVEDVIAFGQKAREELDNIQHSQQRHDALQAEKLRLYTKAREKAEVLTQTRLKAFEELNTRISGTLDFLNMPGVRMTLRHTRGPLASHGQDSVEFYISTNPGEAPKPLAKIASGGELSRITLAIKNAMADKDAVPTVIYDEIDSGVSGKAAGRIGEVLRQSAQGHQILCITHTAQIAALADCHLLIQKNVSNERTYTEIHPLDENGRVEALARLISGDHVTELSRANAREMLQERKHGG